VTPYSSPLFEETEQNHGPLFSCWRMFSDSRNVRKSTECESG